MPGKNRSLDPAPPARCDAVLLLIDVINPLDFPEAKQLLRYLPAMARSIGRLKKRAQKAGIPVVYVNDNFGRWRSDFRSQVEHCLTKISPGREIVRQLQPGQSDYVILKPKHSGFFATPLDPLLRYLGARRLILTGIAANSCVLFTANDAYMRDYKLFVPVDCVASNTSREIRSALQLMHHFLKADIRRSTAIRFKRSGQSRVRKKRSG